MIFNITFVRGNPTSGSKELSQYLKTLSGNYTIDINEENTNTTAKECRSAYFFKVDIVSRHSGDEKYDIHEAFKKYIKIDSTKNYTTADWKNLIKQFQIYIFEKYDIII